MKYLQKSFWFSKRGLILLTVLLITIAFSLRLVFVLSQFTANILFQDHWVTHLAFIDELPLFAKLQYVYTYQHGVHRMGIANILTYVVASMTSWNMLANAYLNLTILFASMLIFLWIKTKYIAPLALTDSIFPILFLSLKHYEILIIVPILSARIFPLFLLGIYLWIYRANQKNPFIYVLLSMLTGIALYTGYGFFLVLITLGLFLIDKQNTLLAISALLLFTIIPTVFFFHSYMFVLDTTCSTNVSMFIERFFPFTGTLIAYFFVGLQGLIQPYYWIVGVIMFITLISIYFRLFHIRINKPKIILPARIITILISYSLLFIGSTAIGRACLGVNHAAISRYVLDFIPAFLGLYFFSIYYAKTMKAKQIYNGIIIFLISILVCFETAITEPVIHGLSDQKAKKDNWIACYKKHENWKYCDGVTNVEAFTIMDEKNFNYVIRYMKEHKLNLYAQ